MVNFRIAKTAKILINQAFPQFRCYVATASNFIGRKNKKRKGEEHEKKKS